MHANARRGVALAVAALGVATLLPLAVGGVVNLVSGPESKFGARRRLRKIRDAGAGHAYFEEDFGEAGVA